MLQVPAAVAKVWQGQTRDAIRNNRQVPLGTLETSSDGGKRVLELANCAALENERIPKHYKVEEAATSNAVATFLFSSKNSEGVSTISQSCGRVAVCNLFNSSHSFGVCSTGGRDCTTCSSRGYLVGRI